jgi:hypothetical protein
MANQRRDLNDPATILQPCFNRAPEESGKKKSKKRSNETAQQHRGGHHKEGRWQVAKCHLIPPRNESLANKSSGKVRLKFGKRLTFSTSDELFFASNAPKPLRISSKTVTRHS